MLPHNRTRQATQEPNRSTPSLHRHADEGHPQPQEAGEVLDVDHRTRRLRLIKRGEGGYPRSVLSRFTHLVGTEALCLIIEEKVILLLRRAGVAEVDAVLDACFVKAWSVRDPESNRVGFSNKDARVGRNGRGYDLGYKLHTSVERARCSRSRDCSSRRCS